MRGECVVDESHAFRDSVVGNFFRRSDAANATTVDLYEAHAAVVDQMLRHIDVMRALTAGELYLASLRQRAIRIKRTRREGLLEPNCANPLERRQTLRRAFHVVDKNLAGIDQ